ncbi:MAG: hypothetical protein HRU19_16930 [Pseudobacteriovorax sp.]|nr:hypothetical protein [Pseudobacteriovorax sp.]
MEQDFIMRAIRQFIRTMAKALGLIERKEFTSAQQILDSELERLTGLSVSDMKNMAPQSLGFLIQINRDDYQKLIIADVLFHKSLACDGQENHVESNLFRETAKILFDSIAKEFSEDDYSSLKQKLSEYLAH